MFLSPANLKFHSSCIRVRLPSCSGNAEASEQAHIRRYAPLHPFPSYRDPYLAKKNQASAMILANRYTAVLSQRAVFVDQGQFSPCFRTWRIALTTPSSTELKHPLAQRSPANDTIRTRLGIINGASQLLATAERAPRCALRTRYVVPSHKSPRRPYPPFPLR
jgi:hypothetical protein